MKITKNKIQVLLVHGGITFKNEKDYLHYLKTKKVTTKKEDFLDGRLFREKFRQKV